MTGRYSHVTDAPGAIPSSILALARHVFAAPEAELHLMPHCNDCEGQKSGLCDNVPLQAPDGSDAGVFCLKLPAGHAGLDETGRRMLACLASIARNELELRRTGEELRDATQEARQANRYRAEFTSRMSHELRTPLNSVLGIAQLLEQDDLAPQQLEDVQRILRAGRHLLALINEVLDISRVESGRLTLEVELIGVQSVLAAAVDLVRPLMDQRHITFRCEAEAGLPLLCADRQRLTQVLLNLLSNAVKYNREGGQIRAEVLATSDDRLRIRIADTGPGISPDDLPKLFRPFERLKATRTQAEGTGLGLALCKTLIEAMGGEIGVESTPGSGSTFWIELASVPDDSGDPMVPSPTPSVLETIVDSQRGTVLYIEDNATNLALIERAVAKALPHVRLVSTMLGRQGIEMAIAHHPDVILLDLHLPDMHGTDIIVRLQADPRTAGIPVIAVSADAAEETRIRALDAGARDFVTKPVHIVSLIRAVSRLLRKESRDHVCK